MRCLAILKPLNHKVWLIFILHYVGNIPQVKMTNLPLSAVWMYIRMYDCILLCRVSYGGGGGTGIPPQEFENITYREINSEAKSQIFFWGRNAPIPHFVDVQRVSPLKPKIMYYV